MNDNYIYELTFRFNIKSTVKNVRLPLSSNNTTINFYDNQRKRTSFVYKKNVQNLLNIDRPIMEVEEEKIEKTITLTFRINHP